MASPLPMTHDSPFDGVPRQLCAYELQYLLELQCLKTTHPAEHTRLCSLTTRADVWRADTLLANLTVHEMLLYTAEMRNQAMP